MPEQIRQEYSLDTSGAVQNLDNLCNAYARLENATRSLIASQRDLNGTSTNSVAAMQKVVSLTSSASKGLEQNAKSVKSLTISWETMTRVVMTQAIVRALSSIRNEIRRSVDDMSEFQKKVAEIQTIGGQADTADIIKSISDQFAFDLSDVGAAYYQTLSNQIPVAESAEFMEATATFAKAGVTDMEAAVNLLSGTINAYGMDVSQVDEISSKFFKTIELGRTTAKEMANDLGRVIPIAAQLGISLEELDADYATITISGIKSNMAVTQLSGAMMAFIKPTEAMKDALVELGYPTGEAIVQALGFKEALEAVIQTTDGTMESIGKLSPRIRGLLGTLVLTGEGAEKAAKNLELIEKVNTELAEQKAADIMATDAAKVAEEWNKLQNAITTDIGGHILAVNRDIFELIGGAENLIGVINFLVPITESAGLALAYLGIKSLAARIGLTSIFPAATVAQAGLVGVTSSTVKTNVALATLGKTAKAIPGYLMAIGIGWSLGTTIRDWLDGPSEAFLELERKHKESIKKFKRTEQERIKALDESNRAWIKSFIASTPESYKAFEKQEFFSRESFSDSIDAVSDFLDKVVDRKQKALDEIKDGIKSMEDDIKASMERSMDLTARLEDRGFLRSIKNKTDSGQLSALISKSEDLYKRAERQMAAGNVDQALKTYERAEDMASRAEGKASNRWEEVRAAEALDKILKSQNKAETSLRASLRSKTAYQKQVQAAAEKTLAVNEKDIEKIQHYLDKLEKQGSLKPFEYEELQKYLGKFGFDPDIHWNAEKAAEQLKTQLRTNFKDYALAIGIKWELIESLEQFLDQQLDPSSLNKALNSLAGSSKEHEQALGKYKQAQQEILAAREKFNERISTVSTTWTSIAGTDSLDGRQELNALIQDMTGLSQKAKITSEDIQRVEEKWKSLVDANTYDLLGWKFQNIFLKQDFKALLTAGKQLDQIRQLQQLESPGTNVFQDQLNLMKSSVQQLRPEIAGSFQVGVEKTNQLNQNLVTTNQLIEQAGQKMQNWNTQPSAAQLQRLFGGSIGYYSSGGFARGTDTIPAMLSPGEFVLNSQATGKFFSQIQAINAGVQPVFRQPGGSVTTIGDISISVNESKTPQQTARQVLSSIRRELRRGSSRL